MQTIKNSILLVALFLITATTHAQKVVKSSSEVTYAIKLGTVTPSEIDVAESEKDELKKRSNKSNNRLPRNFKGRFPKKIVNPSKVYTGPDAVLQKDDIPIKSRPIDTILVMDGLFSDGNPSDPTIDVGKNYFLQAVNSTVIAVYDRNDFSLVTTFTGNSLWSSVGFRSGGDPIILYDQGAERWLITEFPTSGPNENNLLVAISKTSDPLGEFDTYVFGTPNFPDYPKYTVWNNEYALTTQEENSNSHITYFLNRQDLIDGADEVRIIRTSVEGSFGAEQFFLTATPVDWSGKTTPPAERGPMVISLADASWTTGQSEDMINVNSFEIDWETETLEATLTQVPVADYRSYACADDDGSGFQCIPQRGGQGLDGLPEIIPFQPHYRNFGAYETMVFNFITDVGTGGEVRSGIRWVELRRNAVDDWSLYQEGTYAPNDGLHRFMGSIAMDGAGNIGLAYCVSSDTTYTGIKFTGRNAGDALGAMTLPEATAAEGRNTIRSFGRFGDYPHMTIDPRDDNTFWFTGEYANEGDASTRILAFRVSKLDYDLSPVSVNQPVSSANLSSTETVQVEIKNLGLNPITDYKVGYQIENQPKVEEQIGVAIGTDQTYTYNFAQQADFSEIGVYNLKLFTSYVEDNTLFNDTIKTVIEKFPFNDLAVKEIDTGNQSICGTEAEISYTIENVGVLDIVSHNIDIILNGTSINSGQVQYIIPAGQDTTITIMVEDLINADNIIEVRVSNPNGVPDEVRANNELTKTFNVLAEGEAVFLDILTDFYPNETSWSLFDLNENLLFESNGTLVGMQQMNVIEEFCLERDSCYTFVIYDNASDGLTSFAYEDGSYEIRDAAGKVYAGLLEANFGSEESNSFCFNDDCNLAVDVETTEPSNSDDGTVLLTVVNGVGPEFTYSIDGQTYSEENLFSNLAPGFYVFYVRDAHGCEVTLEVNLTMVSTTSEAQDKVTITLAPNPTSGLFNIVMKGYESASTMLPVSILNAEGKTVQRSTVSKFSGVYKGTVSLYKYPQGTYFVKVDVNDRHIMKKIIRQ